MQHHFESLLISQSSVPITIELQRFHCIQFAHQQHIKYKATHEKWSLDYTSTCQCLYTMKAGEHVGVLFWVKNFICTSTVGCDKLYLMQFSASMEAGKVAEKTVPRTT